MNTNGPFLFSQNNTISTCLRASHDAPSSRKAKINDRGSHTSSARLYSRQRKWIVKAAADIFAVFFCQIYVFISVTESAGRLSTRELLQIHNRSRLFRRKTAMMNLWSDVCGMFGLEKMLATLRKGLCYTEYECQVTKCQNFSNGYQNYVNNCQKHVAKRQSNVNVT